MALSGFRLFAKRALVAVNILIVFLFLLACLATYISPAKWWLFSMLSIGFPFLAIATILFFIFWLFVKARLALISAVALLTGLNSLSVLFAVNRQADFRYTKKPDELRIVSWNVARFVEMKKNNNKGSGIRLKMMEELKAQDADILCLQEFHSSDNPAYYNNIKYVQEELNYPYFFFSYEPDGDGHWYSSIIFSRLPIVDTSKIYYPGRGYTDLLLHAGVQFNGDTISVYNTHLQSVHFKPKDYEKIDRIQHGDDGLLDNTRSIFYKIKRASVRRSRQVLTVREQLDKDHHPVLFAGDLNDVPTSYAYAQIRGDMQDVFLEKGWGIGRTFASLSPTLRIDYIFVSDNFSVSQFKRYPADLSDHYMIVTDVKLKAK